MMLPLQHTFTRRHAPLRWFAIALLALLLAGCASRTRAPVEDRNAPPARLAKLKLLRTGLALSTWSRKTAVPRQIRWAKIDGCVPIGWMASIYLSST